ncbi:hypothetical protein SAMN04488096_1157 [Mesonia phycicola]|uniref:Uncharacterized protein n=1 Tax=Mesonia phycicola TaxID=579105 RepID=A0A1M6HN01_9FLAO|nr:hypothetical protein [Mesonia phycicola]SHJ23557.1 hypothetical protein SAMN04488096_1157 [Mesonia phycicola]
MKKEKKRKYSKVKKPVNIYLLAFVGVAEFIIAPQLTVNQYLIKYILKLRH